MSFIVTFGTLSFAIRPSLVCIMSLYHSVHFIMYFIAHTAFVQAIKLMMMMITCVSCTMFINWTLASLIVYLQQHQQHTCTSRTCIVVSNSPPARLRVRVYAWSTRVTWPPCGEGEGWEWTMDWMHGVMEWTEFIATDVTAARQLCVRGV